GAVLLLLTLLRALEPRCPLAGVLLLLMLLDLLQPLLQRGQFLAEFGIALRLRGRARRLARRRAVRPAAVRPGARQAPEQPRRRCPRRNLPSLHGSAPPRRAKRPRGYHDDTACLPYKQSAFSVSEILKSLPPPAPGS